MNRLVSISVVFVIVLGLFCPFLVYSATNTFVDSDGNPITNLDTSDWDLESAIDTIIAFTEDPVQTVMWTTCKLSMERMLMADNAVAYMVDDTYLYKDTEGDYYSAVASDPYKLYRLTHGGGGGRHRDPVVSSKLLKSTIDKVNSYYCPAQDSDFISWASNPFKHYLKTLSSNFIAVPLFWDGTFLGRGWIEMYVVKFYKDSNGLMWYSSQQIHYYQILDSSSGANKITMYADYTDFFDPGYSGNKLLADGNRQNYPYIVYNFSWPSNQFWYFNKNYADFMDLKNGVPVNVSASDYSTFYCASDSSLSFVDSPSDQRIRYALNYQTPDTTDCDVGFIVSQKPIEMNGMLPGFDKSLLNDDDIITLTGDNFYDYSVSNISGDTTTIYNVINNNGGSSGNGGNSGSMSGDITVGGKVDVGGQVDVNVNVNVGNSNSSDLSDPFSPVVFDPSNYLSDVADEALPVTNFLSVFFDFLPTELLVLLVGGVAVAIWCRIFGR